MISEKVMKGLLKKGKELKVVFSSLSSLPNSSNNRSGVESLVPAQLQQLNCALLQVHIGTVLNTVSLRLRPIRQPGCKTKTMLFLLT